MQSLVVEVLTAWRRAERLAGELPPGPERDAAQHACERLRELYQELTGGRSAAEGSAELMALRDLVGRLDEPRSTA